MSLETNQGVRLEFRTFVQLRAQFSNSSRNRNTFACLLRYPCGCFSESWDITSKQPGQLCQWKMVRLPDKESGNSLSLWRAEGWNKPGGQARVSDIRSAECAILQ